MSTHLESLGKIFEDCYSAFCKEIGSESLAELAHTERNWVSSPGAAPVVSFLSFGGENLTGAVYLGCKPNFLKSTNPVSKMGRNLSSEDQLDWAGEICNQLLGRFKNVMIKTGNMLAISMPVVLSGRDFKIDAVKDHQAIFYRNKSMDGVYLAVFFKLGSNFKLDLSSAETGSVAAEGDALFF